MQELKDSELRYRRLFEAAQDGILILDARSGIINDVNPYLVKMLGYSKDEFQDKKLWEVGAFRDIEASKEAFEALQEHEYIRFDDLPLKTKSGQLVQVEFVSNVYMVDGEKVIQCNIRDITENKRMMIALQENEMKYRALVDQSPDGIFVFDLAGKFLTVNSMMCKLLQYSESELLSMGIWDIVPNRYCDQYKGRAEKIRNGEPLVEASEYEVRAKNGKLYTVEVISAPHFVNKKMIGIQGIARNITVRKDNEHRIRRQLAFLTALSDIDRVITASFDINASLSEVLTHATTELEVDAADILILNSDFGVLEYGAERGFYTKPAMKTQVHIDRSHAGQVVLDHQMIHVSNLQDEKGNWFLPDFLSREEFVCYYGVPLIVKGQVKGVLEVYHRTPMDPDTEWLGFLNALARQASIAIENSMLFEGLQRSNLELTLAYDATIKGWSRALDLRDKETEWHTQRVTEMTVNLARAIGLDNAELAQIRWGSLLHDIGKMGVPDVILRKPGTLTEEEWAVMKMHPTYAYEMLSPIRYLRLALDIPYCHHEKWDGTGYPQGLKGAQIPLAARIFAVVDVWDSLNSDRPYRAAWTPQKAREYIGKASGTHFDPQVVDVFMQIPMITESVK